MVCLGFLLFAIDLLESGKWLGQIFLQKIMVFFVSMQLSSLLSICLHMVNINFIDQKVFNNLKQRKITWKLIQPSWPWWLWWWNMPIAQAYQSNWHSLYPTVYWQIWLDWFCYHNNPNSPCSPRLRVYATFLQMSLWLQLPQTSMNRIDPLKDLEILPAPMPDVCIVGTCPSSMLKCSCKVTAS